MHSLTGMIKFNSSAPRVVVEIICGAIGFFGIVHAPMIESETAVLLAVIAGVVVAIELIYPLANRRGLSLPLIVRTFSLVPLLKNSISNSSGVLSCIDP